jgi:predicted nucleic acid-binding protein
VIAVDVVVAEACSSFGEGEDVMRVLEDMGIAYVPVAERAAILAGDMQKRYRERGGRRQRSVPDFIVGAHAMLQCTALITRDSGFFRDYFKGLKVLVPSGA